jgi:hypothetical protein
MANWFEVRAGTMTEAEARAYFGRPTIRSQRDGDMMGYLVILLKRQPFLSRIG